jgi:hypothetical protein
MSIIKTVSPGGWDFDRPTVMTVKMARNGLCGDDRREFVKMAGSNIFLPELDRIKVASDEELLHAIALGASEWYGPNRNGDGFKEATCIQCVPTFVKFARFYRNHKNKPEKGHPWYGIVKAAAYNPVMHRVELLLALNKEKSACDRNGGLIADVEMEKLARGEDLPTSMACRVPWDECSWCGHKAATRKQYCTAGMCKAGGCKENLTRVVKVAGDMHHLHVNNPHPVWFDFSRVFRAADRISAGARADYMDKCASDDFELAEFIKVADDETAPYEVVVYQDGNAGEWTTKIASQIKLAYGLAALELVEGNRDPEVYRAFVPVKPFPTDVLGQPGTEKCAAALGALADKKIILNIHDFSRLAGMPGLAKEAAVRLPGVYQRMIDDDSLERRIEQNKFPMTEKLAASRQRAVAGLVAEDFSLEKEAVWHRSVLSAMRGETVPVPKSGFMKVGSDNAGAEQLARDYATYKIAALQRIAAFDHDFTLTARMAIRQNHVL